ncbi:ribokinase [Agromyces endophyticus]|uniref:ribokinase n=1 Tax=Agromyces sp. H17E-10 TaxID=2932244 RepID=UPI001FD492CE|nr:ribokinase [Agromyces sp. H17E-10]UOQ87746.1 ribokinase [Agromyces sp. H17E-10]
MTERGSRVLVVGSLNVDATTYVARFPAPGETIAAHGFQTALGGKGSNQAVAAHLAGADVELVARIGDDANGRLALSVLDGFGLPTTGVERVAGAPTGIAQITVADSGENTVIVAAGANHELGPAVVDDVRDRIAGAGVVLTQGELPVETIERLAATCADLGVRFVLNLAPPVVIDPAALAVCDPLVVNEHEARAVGIGAADGDADASGPTSLDAWRAFAAAAVGTVARSVVVTLGAAGAVAATAEGSWTVAAPQVEAVDTTGAGDCFTGTLTAFLAEGRPVAEAARIAAVAGALAVQRRGTVDSYVPRETLLDTVARLDGTGRPDGTGRSEGAGGAA